MGLKKFFKRLGAAIGITVLAIFTIGTGGIGGAGFWAAIKAVGWRGALGFFFTNVVLGEVAYHLTPSGRPRQAQGRLPVFSSASRAQNLIGRKEVPGLITWIDEGDSDWLKVVYTVVAHPCEMLIGVRVMGNYSLMNDWRETNLLAKTTNSTGYTLADSDVSDRLRFYWNLTGQFDAEVNEAMGIPEDYKGNDVAWVGVWIKRDNWFRERGFSLDAFAFKVARTREAYREIGENPAIAVAEHLKQYFRVTEEQIDQESLQRAARICDTVTAGNKQRANGYWLSGTQYEVLQQLLDAMDGVLIQARDRFFIHANPLSTDPAPTITITEAMLVNEVFNSPLPEWDDLYNACRATYNDDTTGDVVSTPRYVFASYQGQDNGIESTYDAGHFQFLERAGEVKRVITQRTARSRYATQVNLSIVEGLLPRLEAWDKVYLDIPSAGLANNGDQYRILGIIGGLDGRLDLVLQREHSSNWFPALHTEGDIINPDISTAPPDNRYMDPPDDLSGFRITNTTETSISLAWDAIGAAYGYMLGIQKDGDIGFTTIEVRGATTYTYTNLSPGTRYTFRAWALSNGGRSRNHAEVSGETDDAVQAPDDYPRNLAVVYITSNSLSVGYDAVEGAASYLLEYRTGSGRYSQVVVRGRAYTIRNLLSATTYQIRVRAQNSAGNGPVSPIIQATTNARVRRPAIPVILTPVLQGDGTSSILASWRSVSGAGYYVLQYRERGGRWSAFAQQTSLSRSVRGLKAETQYQFRVKAGNSAGESGWSRTVSVSTLAVTTPTRGTPAKVTGVAIEVYTDGIWRRMNLSWDDDTENAAARNGFQFQTRRGPQTWAQALTRTRSGSPENGIFLGGFEGTVYARVRAVNTGGDVGPWSDEASATVGS